MPENEANEQKHHAREAEAALARARELLARPGPLDEKVRADALAALEALSRALEPALRSHPDEARTVGHFTEAIALEATRPEPSPSLVRAGLDGLSGAVERLEERYPTLAGVAHRIADALANIGI